MPAVFRWDVELALWFWAWLNIWTICETLLGCLKVLRCAEDDVSDAGFIRLNPDLKTVCVRGVNVVEVGKALEKGADCADSFFGEKVLLLFVTAVWLVLPQRGGVLGAFGSGQKYPRSVFGGPKTERGAINRACGGYLDLAPAGAGFFGVPKSG
jgi:hypothetical protein